MHSHLATLSLPSPRDPSDLVRFGAIEAMTGAVASANASLNGGKAGSSGSSTSGARDETVQRQRRGRAWRLLVAQSGVQVCELQQLLWLADLFVGSA